MRSLFAILLFLAATILVVFSQADAAVTDGHPQVTQQQVFKK